MPNILEVYKRYKITEALQRHQLRVAAVAQQICDSLIVPVDTKTVVTACLLHDMGNIIKFELNYADEFYAPQGREYWREVQAEYFQKYGRDEHKATLDIASELGMNGGVIKIIDSIGFSNIRVNYRGGNFESKIANYSDMRVGPNGLFSIDERLADGRMRYSHRRDYFIDDSKRLEIAKDLHGIEKQIFAKSKIRPTDITDESVAPIIEQLKTYQT